VSTEVKVPRLAESISEAVLVEWLKPDGAEVRTDEAIATLETDKAAVEIAAPEGGVLRHARTVGERVVVGDVIARIEAGVPAGRTEAPVEAGKSRPAAAASGQTARPTPGPARRTPEPAQRHPDVPPRAGRAEDGVPGAGATETLSPSVRRLIEEHRLDPAEIEPSGKGGRLLKEDVLRHIERKGEAERRGSAASTSAPPVAPSAPAPARASAVPIAPAARELRAPAAPGSQPTSLPVSAPAPAAEPARMPAAPKAAAAPAPESTADERVVPMSRIRLRIAERLVQAQHTAAILTTFNEIDMSAVMELRARYREGFEKRHGVRLGLMSFFARASVLALDEIPELNAEIRGSDLVYKRRVHLGIAVGTERGLVVPVVRDADRLGFAEIEREIERLAARARDGTLTLQELSGGTFTISNGGVYGSLLSTPILNPPQSGILGMHKIEKRPIAVDDQVVIRSMMYVALSYDHRIVDGEQAVTFLRLVKERIEDPERMLLDV
jgi:2-oxoglutarate dehydrogenase E2 component (dihydrolipoamide succinyltransferase)